MIGKYSRINETFFVNIHSPTILNTNNSIMFNSNSTRGSQVGKSLALISWNSELFFYFYEQYSTVFIFRKSSIDSQFNAWESVTMTFSKFKCTFYNALNISVEFFADVCLYIFSSSSLEFLVKKALCGSDNKSFSSLSINYVVG